MSHFTGLRKVTQKHKEFKKIKLKIPNNRKATVNNMKVVNSFILFFPFESLSRATKKLNILNAQKSI